MQPSSSDANLPITLQISGMGKAQFSELSGLDLKATPVLTSFRLPGGQSGSQIILTKGVSESNETLHAFLAQPDTQPREMQLEIGAPLVEKRRKWRLSGVFFSQIDLQAESSDPLIIHRLTLSYAYLEEIQED